MEHVSERRTRNRGHRKAWSTRVAKRGRKGTHSFHLYVDAVGRWSSQHSGIHITIPGLEDTYIASLLLVQQVSDRIGSWVLVAFILLAARSEDRVWDDPSDFTALHVSDCTGHDTHDAAVSTSVYEGPVCCYERMCYGCVECIFESRDVKEIKK